MLDWDRPESKWTAVAVLVCAVTGAIILALIGHGVHPNSAVVGGPVLLLLWLVAAVLVRAAVGLHYAKLFTVGSLLFLMFKLLG